MSQEANKNCHPLYVIKPSVPFFIAEGEGSSDGDSGEGGEGGDSTAASATSTDTTTQKQPEQKADTEKSSMSEGEAKLLKDVMKWKDKARSLEATQGEMQTQLSSLSDTQSQLSAIKEAIGDVQLDDLKSLVDAKKQAETKAMEDKGQYEQIVEQMKAEHGAKTKLLSDSIDTTKEELSYAKKQIDALTVGRAFSDSTFVRNRSVLTPNISLKEFGGYFDFDGDNVVAYNKPRGAEDRAPLVDSEGNKQPFDAAIEKLYAAHPDSAALIKSTQKPGAGSKPTESTNGSGETTTKQLRGLDRISAGLQALNN